MSEEEILAKKTLAIIEANTQLKIIEAEKHIPKKLICIENEKCCPVCKEGIYLTGDGNYCRNCEQALDWSDE